MTQRTTSLLSVDLNQLDAPRSVAALQRAADLLRAGGTVAFPTETVYGLGANAIDGSAVARIFEAKERPAWDPLIVHVSDAAMLATIVRNTSAAAQKLMDAFWPGPLTLLLPRSEAVPDAVTAGRELVGVRMPRHAIAHAVIAAAGVPVAAPSANRFGRISPTTAAHVLEDLDGRIDAVLDGGPTQLGVESTVIDVSSSKIVCYRPGVITQAQIEAIVGPISMFAPQTENEHPESQPAPGTGLRHYAPRAKLALVDKSSVSAASGELLRLVALHAASGAMVGVMLPSGWQQAPGTATVFQWGDWTNGSMLAERLFAGLRTLDAAGVNVIVCPLPPNQEIGVAIRDRLLKAARVG